MKYIGVVDYYWKNPTRKQEDEGNIPTVILRKGYDNFSNALEEVKNKAKQASIAILKSNKNKYKQLPVCKYYVKIVDSWLVAEGQVIQGKITQEWIDNDIIKIKNETV